MRRRPGRGRNPPHTGPTRSAQTSASSVGIIAFIALVTIPSCGQLIELTGRFSLDTVTLPIPATLVGEIQLDAPAELTVLKHGIEATLDLELIAANMLVHLNTAMNIAGSERFILESTIPLGPVTIAPELWFAVPFETVTDVNGFINWVTIPPAKMLFVKTRWTVSTHYGGLDIEDLFLLEDVNFPDPDADFGPLTYPIQSQSFRYGNILTISATPIDGISLTSVTCICADSSSNDVKGWSASGGAYAACGTGCSWFNETITVSGLRYSCLLCWLSLYFDPAAVPVIVLRGGGSFSGIGGLELSGAFSLFPISLAGFSFSASLSDCAEASISLSDTLGFLSASIRFSAGLPLGSMRGTFAWNGTVTAASGLTGCSIAATVSQGIFSGGMTVNYVQQMGNLEFMSTTTRLGLSFDAVHVSASVEFGRAGLRCARFGVGVTL
jgi:hypothetical protein